MIRKRLNPKGGRALLAASLAAIAASVALAACGGDDNGSNASTTRTQTSTTAAANDRGSENVAGKPEVSIELDDFYFKPTTLQGKPGQSVKLELENEGAVEHNFSLPQQNVDQDVANGEKATVEVKLPQSGTLRFFCKYHRSQGMTGSLAVAGSSGGSSSGSSASSGSSGGGGGGY